jgi:hypothetical protein
LFGYGVAFLGALRIDFIPVFDTKWTVVRILHSLKMVYPLAFTFRLFEAFFRRYRLT